MTRPLQSIRILALLTTLAASGGLLTAFPAAATPRPTAAARPGHAVTTKLATPKEPGAAEAAHRIGQAGVVSGIVVGPGEIPLAGICVSAIGTGSFRMTRTAANGRYVFTGIRPGLYAFTYTDCQHTAGNGYLQRTYQGARTLRGGHVLVAGGRLTRLSPVTLQPALPQVAIATEQSRLAASGKAGKGPFISGMVRSRSGKPLAGICVEAYASQTLGPGFVFSWYLFAQTNKSGRYSFPRALAIPAHNYRVLFTVGCGNSGNYAPQWWRYSNTRRGATLLNVRRTSTFSHINATLIRGAIVTGTVRAINDKGAGLSGACVIANGRAAMSDARVATTSAKGGHYVLRGLGTGLFFIHFSPYCGMKGNFLNSSGPIVRVTDDKTVKGIDGAMPLGGEITGTVTSKATGQPLAGICTEFEGQTANTIFGAIVPTNGKGNYSFRHLVPGSYAVAFAGGCGNTGSYAPQFLNGPPSVDGVITIGHGTVAHADAAMLPGGTIGGQVTVQTAGNAPANACVVVASPQGVGELGGGIPGLDFLLQPTAIAFANPDGSYEIPNLAPGPYITEFASCAFGPSPYAPDWYSPEGDGAPDWLSVNAGVITGGVNGTLAAGGSISGTVSSKSGHPVAQVCVTPQSPSDPFSALNQFFGSGPATSGNAGRYTATGLPAGQYTVEFAPCGGGAYAPQWYSGQGSQAAATPVAVTLGNLTSGINAVMTAGGSVAGHVSSAITGLPASFTCVAIVDSLGNVVSLALAGPGGDYKAALIGPGTYSAEPSQCLNPQPVLAAVTRPGVQVTDGQTTSGIDFALPRAGAISGVITTGTPPVPAAGTCVDAIPVTGDGQIEVGLPSPDGSYVLPGLAAGTYQLLFTNACIFGAAGLAPAQATATVSPGANTTVNAAIPADGAISGTVTSSGSAQGVSGICVGAYPSATSTTSTEVAITGSDGSYELADLTPGSYIVKFSTGCGSTGYATQWWDNASAAATAQPVGVNSGPPVTGIDATLSP